MALAPVREKRLNPFWHQLPRLKPKIPERAGKRRKINHLPRAHFFSKKCTQRSNCRRLEPNCLTQIFWPPPLKSRQVNERNTKYPKIKWNQRNHYRKKQHIS